MKKQTILFLSGTLGYGGAERRTLLLINELVNYDFEVHLGLFDKNGSYMPSLSKKCHLHLIKSPPLIRYYVRIFFIIKLLYKFKPEIIYSNLWGAAFLIRRALSFYKHPVKFVYGISNTLETPKKNRKEFIRLLENEENILILQTNLIKEKVLKYRKSDKNIYIIPNIIDPEFVRDQVVINKMNNSDEFQLIHVGSFVKQKRHDRLLKIIEILKNRNLRFKVNFLGEGPLKNEIIKLSESMGLNNVVRFQGYLNNPFQWVANSDVLLLTSDFEGMPMALIEALTLGTPVVSTDIEFGPQEIIENGFNGYFIPPNDLIAFADAVLKVLKDKVKFSKNAYKSSEKFFVKTHIPNYLKILESARSTSKKRRT